MDGFLGQVARGLPKFELDKYFKDAAEAAKKRKPLAKAKSDKTEAAEKNEKAEKSENADKPDEEKPKSQRKAIRQKSLTNQKKLINQKSQKSQQSFLLTTHIAEFVESRRCPATKAI